MKIAIEFISPKIVAPLDVDDPTYVKSFGVDQREAYTQVSSAEQVLSVS
jgi:hypothetical protein